MVLWGGFDATAKPNCDWCWPNGGGSTGTTIRNEEFQIPPAIWQGRPTRMRFEAILTFLKRVGSFGKQE